jgi:predicted dienelactone hydrolase
MKKILAIVFLALVLPWQARAELAVGVKTLRLNNNGKSLSVMVWYPAEVVANSQPFGYYDLIKGKAVFNAQAQRSRHPLVLFSHGLGMCSFQSVFLMEYLAANGYIVAAPDHDDAAMCHIGGGSDISDCQLTKATLKSMGNLDKNVQELFPDKIHYLLDPAYRPQQMSFVLGSLLGDSEFGQLVDPTKIGVMGHSFGGWTAEALAGAEIDCRNPESYAASVCEAPDEKLATGKHNSKICCHEPYRGQISHFRDDRVKAALAFGPGAFIFPNYEAMNTVVPVMVVMGDHFEVDFAQNGYEALNAVNPPIYLIVWRDVGHMTVSDVAYARPGAPLLRQFWRYDAKKELYQNWSLGFFRRYLENNDSLLWRNLCQSSRMKIFFARQ